MNYDGWYSRAQVAKALDISTEYVQSLTKSGRLQFAQTSLGRLYDPESVDAAKAAGIGQLRRRATAP
jgi:hypothetical protein